eukprot:CAMPEP_0174704714 /NCGR_PEP_ID=MMETSP1094-20130205/8203_1 /TAXON_ID=156173 /ORGANISM="Chrysochromulina brevifilum, Strain UTEX LB 985" /LENGTH=257 /DNA_ID=CAMNT_0015902799 /DNA_START=32 /DNA_END=801 /DNA_ORIENTATION=+
MSTDYLTDARLTKVPFMKLKNFVKEKEGEIPDLKADLFPASTKFAIVAVAEKHGIKLDTLLAEFGPYVAPSENKSSPMPPRPDTGAEDAKKAAEAKQAEESKKAADAAKAKANADAKAKAEADAKAKAAADAAKAKAEADAKAAEAAKAAEVTPPPATPAASGKYPRENKLMTSPAGAKYKLCVVQFKVEGAKNGGSDKGPDGNRIDSIPIANGVIHAGAACDLLLYDANNHGAFVEATTSYDALIVRINPGQLSQG